MLYGEHQYFISDCKTLRMITTSFKGHVFTVCFILKKLLYQVVVSSFFSCA